MTARIDHMDRYANCIAHNSSDCRMVIGETRTAVFDCGMAFCAQETLRMAEDALRGRPLDYIFATHTHYDHIGALPHFRKKWPQVRLAASEIGAAVLLKDTPRRVIRELSAAAAVMYGAECDMDYSDDVFHADMIVRDKDVIPLGGLSVEVLETPGHTRDSLCFFIPELELLILNETPGVLMPDDSLYPCYLTGYHDAMNSTEKCRNTPYRHLSFPHRGIIAGTDDFFDRAMAVNAECRDFILGMKDKSEEEILNAFCQKYASETLLTYQPMEAFAANARATIACTLRDYANNG